MDIKASSICMLSEQTLAGFRKCLLSIDPEEKKNILDSHLNLINEIFSEEKDEEDKNIVEAIGSAMVCKWLAEEEIAITCDPPW